MKQPNMFLQSPEEVLDYKFEWSRVFDTMEYIEESELEVDGGADLRDINTLGLEVSFKFAPPGEGSYRVVNTITTNSGRTFSDSIYIQVWRR